MNNIKNLGATIARLKSKAHISFPVWLAVAAIFCGSQAIYANTTCCVVDEEKEGPIGCITKKTEKEAIENLYGPIYFGSIEYRIYEFWCKETNASLSDQVDFHTGVKARDLEKVLSFEKVRIVKL